MNNIIEKNKLRENIIAYIYSYQLFNKKLDSIDAFESGNYTNQEIKIIENISSKEEKFISLIKRFTKDDWKWERISPLHRAILIFSAYEMIFNDVALVIDVMIKYSKKYSDPNSYKFIHSILDKIGKVYEKNKKDKKEV